MKLQIVIKLKRSSNSTCLYHKINDEECDLINFNDKCYHDGGDCCPNVAKIGDSFCNPENDIKACNFDGGDCCLTERINDGFCDPVNYNRMCKFDGNDCYCKYNLIENGICDLVNNKAMCDYDGGDCCDWTKVGDGLCNWLNNNPKCQNDAGDCCEGDTSFWGNWRHNNGCDEDLNNEACLYDKGACCRGNRNLIWDGVCQEYNNNPACEYDGGDCLECMHTDWIENGQCKLENLSPHVLCHHYAQIGDGICQDENNVDLCMYDGGDCCLAELNSAQCTECHCISEEDEFDPCPEGDRISDGACNLSNNKTICSFDGGDCSR